MFVLLDEDGKYNKKAQNLVMKVPYPSPDRTPPTPYCCCRCSWTRSVWSEAPSSTSGWVASSHALATALFIFCTAFSCILL